MTKILFTADIHLGVPGRLEDILWSLRTMREYCHAAKIDTVIILGDLFHDRRSIEIDVLSRAVAFFEETKHLYKQQWIAFPGNHDMFLRHSWNINSLSALRNCLTVIEDVKLLTVDDARFWVLPFITFEKPFMKVIRAIESQYEEGDVLLTHVGIRGATLNTCFLLKDWSTVSFERSKFKRVYTGHFHSKQQVGDNVWYPGSPIPFKFDEGGVSHGFYIYDTEAKDHKFINIWKAGAKFFPNETPPPQFYTVTEDSINEISKDDIANGFVRVAINRDLTTEEKVQIKEKLNNLGAKAVRWMNISENIERQDVIAATPSKNLFKSWVDNDKTGIKGLDVNILLRINDEIIKEGDDKYSVEESEI